MSNTEYASIAMIPFRIGPDWDQHWGPLLDGFPVNIKYVSKFGPKTPVKWSAYEIDLSTFVQGQAGREVIYRNTRGGSYAVRVFLHDDGKLEVHKLNGENLIGFASGRARTPEEFDSAMTNATIIGVQHDEPSTYTTFHRLPLN